MLESRRPAIGARRVANLGFALCLLPSLVVVYLLLISFHLFYENNQKRITFSKTILTSHNLKIKLPTNLLNNTSLLCSLLMQNFPLKIEVVNTFWIYFSLLGSMFETHTAELAPSVRKFAEMEFKAQTSSFSLQNRNWMRP